MEIITMESKAYRHLIERIDNIAAYVRRHVIQEEKEKEAEVWLTSLQVCEILQRCNTLCVDWQKMSVSKIRCRGIGTQKDERSYTLFIK